MTRSDATRPTRLPFALLLTAALAVVPGAAGAANQLWCRSIGDASYQRANSVATDAADNVVVTGYFSGTVDFGTGPLTSSGDGYLAKYDADGTCLWSRQFMATTSISSNMVATDASGNVVVCGMFIGTINLGGGVLTSAGSFDAFVAKYDADGALLWARRFGDNKSQVALGVTCDPDGNVILLGAFYGTLDAGGGPLTSAGFNDVLVAKFSAGGSHLWSRRYGDSNDQWPVTVATDPSGEILLGGWYGGSLDFGSGPHTSLGANDAFLAKLTAAGNEVWSKSFGSAAATDQYVYGVTAGPNGEVYAAGAFYGDVDFGTGLLSASTLWTDGFLVAFTPAGTPRWTKHFADVDYLTDQYVFAVATDAAGKVYVTGSIAGPADFGGGTLSPAGAEDVVVAQYDSSGAHLWSQRFGDPSSQSSNSIATGSGDRVVVAGQFYGSLDFGGGSISDPGQGNGFVVQFGSATDAVGDDPQPTGFAMSACPNPVASATTIQFTLPASGPVALEVFDTRGARVARLAGGTLAAGPHAIRWDRRGIDGRAVPPGVYLARVAHPGGVTSRRIVVLE